MVDTWTKLSMLASIKFCISCFSVIPYSLRIVYKADEHQATSYTHTGLDTTITVLLFCSMYMIYMRLFIASSFKLLTDKNTESEFKRESLINFLEINVLCK